MTAGVLVAMVFVATACSVSDPDLTQPKDLANPAGALVLRAGALAAFANAFSEQIQATGVLTDELSNVSSGDQTDQRVLPVGQTGSISGFPYRDLSASRISVLQAIASLEQYQPSPNWHTAELYADMAYIETFFAEDMCNGIPLGRLVQGLPAFGPAFARSRLIQQALADFDSAAAHATDSDSILNLARVGRGRALLDSGDYSAASAAVATVPVAYVFQATYNSAGSQLNSVNNVAVGLTFQYTVPDREGKNGLPFASAADARVPTQPSSTGFTFTPYATVDAPIVLASGVEATLIQAEAALHAHDTVTWVNLLDSLRQHAAATPIPILSSDSSTLASDTLRQNVTFYERAFWLYLSGHRHGDLRRFVRQYGRQANNVFPIGPYHGGPLQYGNDVTFTPSTDENTNPNYHGCIDRNA